MDAILSEFETLIIGNDYISLSMVFVASVLTVLGVIALFRRDEVGDRLIRAGRRADAAGEFSLRQADSDFRYRAMLDKLHRSLSSGSDKNRSALRLRLTRAGYIHPRAAVFYYLARIGLALILPIIVLGVLTAFVGDASPSLLLLAALAATFLGYFAPFVAVQLRVRERQRLAREGFPDALDMMLVCVEAGLGISAAIDRVSKELGRANRVLSENFTLVGLETRAGTSRSDALKNFAERIGVHEINALVTLLVQSESLGTSIADSLRVYAEEMRTTRLMRAEERANKLPVKIALPLGFGILPCLILVIMTPIIIRFVRVLDPILGN